MDKLKSKISIFKKILLVLVLIFFARFFYNNQNEMLLFLDLSLFSIIILFLLTFVSIYAKSLTFYFYYNFLKLNLSITEVFKISILTRYYNHVFSKGGFIYKSYLFKKILKQSFKKSFFIFSFNSYFNIYSALLLVLILLISDVSYLDYFDVGLLYSLIGFLIILTIPFVFPRKILKRIKINKLHIQKIVVNFLKIKNQKFISVYVLFSMLALILAGVRLNYCFVSLGLEADIYASIFLISIGSLSFLLNLTPGAIGIREGIIYFSASLIGFNQENALLASILDRLISSVFIIVSGYYLQRSAFNYKFIKAND